MTEQVNGRNKREIEKELVSECDMANESVVSKVCVFDFHSSGFIHSFVRSFFVVSNSLRKLIDDISIEQFKPKCQYRNAIADCHYLFMESLRGCIKLFQHAYSLLTGFGSSNLLDPIKRQANRMRILSDFKHIKSLNSDIRSK